MRVLRAVMVVAALAAAVAMADPVGAGATGRAPSADPGRGTRISAPVDPGGGDPLAGVGPLEQPGPLTDTRATDTGYDTLGFYPMGNWVADFASGAEGMRPFVQQAINQLKSDVGFTITMGSNVGNKTNPSRNELLITYLADVSGPDACGDTGVYACGSGYYHLGTPANRVDSGMIIVSASGLALPDGESYHLLAHEIGHTLGLAHHDPLFRDVPQVMYTYDNIAPAYEAGDVNGLRATRYGGAGALPAAGSTATPGAPAGVGVRRHDGAVSVAWSGPLWAGTSSVSEYQVETTPNGGVPRTANTWNGYLSVTGLTNGTQVSVRVRAKNASGYGPWSKAITTTPRPDGGPWTTPAAAVAYVDNHFANWDDPNVQSAYRVPISNSYWRTELTTGPYDYTYMVQSGIGYWSNQQRLGSLYRLYKAYFKRFPDTGGTAYWGNQLRHGASLYTVSSAFAGSAEFKATYGTLNNTAFVNLVYQNVLGRAPDAGGLMYWVGQLNSGVTRGRVMVGFSDSNENYIARSDELSCWVYRYALLGTSSTQTDVNYCLLALSTNPRRSYIESLLQNPAFRP